MHVLWAVKSYKEGNIFCYNGWSFGTNGILTFCKQNLANYNTLSDGARTLDAF